MWTHMLYTIDAAGPASSAVLYSVLMTQLFYGCSYMFHLSGDNSRDRYIKGA